MNPLRRIKPSPSMVVASLALLVALGGTSVAAVAVVVPRNSVGRLQLQNNSVNSLKVQNRSLRAIDFARGQVPKGPRGLRGPAGPAGAPGPSGPAGPAGAAGAAGVASPGYVAEVATAASTSANETTSTSFTNLSDASASITVPSGETDKLVVVFSAETGCYGGTALQRCRVRINVDGNELTPAGGSDAYFDNNAYRTVQGGAGYVVNTSGVLSNHTIVRYSGNLSAGSHTVQVQYSTTSATTAFRLDDWSLVVQRIKVS
jgi:hypothetical protein